jgi:hypothetical protein
VYKVTGHIDLDPASNPVSNQIVKAKKYYTIDDDGFNRAWYGKVFLNPPYGQKNLKKNNYGASAWFDKIWDEYTNGDVSQAIIIGRGDSEGIKNLMRYSIFCECERVHFYKVGKPDDVSIPVPGTKIFYLGYERELFADVFREYGIILKAYH